jgi:hypothetical protein
LAPIQARRFVADEPGSARAASKQQGVLSMGMRSTHLIRAMALTGLVAVAGLAGCARYYQVTDATHGDVYYTESFPEQAYMESGQATFVDAHTGATVTLSDVEVKRVGRKSAHRATMANVSDSD